jgi:hypothetical protein
MVNSEELIGIIEYLTLQARCRIDRCRYNRVILFVVRQFLKGAKHSQLIRAIVLCDVIPDGKTE